MLLWRIEPSPTSIRIGPTLAEDLALHLRYAPLTTVLAQIGSQQQAYVSTPGCAGCCHRRCTPDCRMNLLRRILVADHVATDLRPVPLGLSERPYTRLVLAVPGPQARPLDAELLTPWRDARVWAVWRTVMGQRMVGAALAVGADGPEPLAALRERGWIGIVAPQPLVRQAHQPEPLALPYGWRWTTPAHMLLPRRVAAAPSAAAATEREPIITPAPDDDTGMVLHASAEAPATPFMVAGQVMGLLTAALVAQGRATCATIRHRVHGQISEPLIPEPLITPTLDPAMPDPATLDPETSDPETPEPLPTSAAPRTRRRPERRWTVRVAATAQAVEDTAGVASVEEAPPQPVVDADVAVTEADNTPHAEAAASESVDTQPAETLPLEVEETLPQEVAEPTPVAEPTSATTVEIPAPTLDHAPIPASPREAPAAPIRWVAGPNLTAAEVASLMHALVSRDDLFTGRPGQYGLSPRIVRNQFELERYDAEPLLAWLEAAELVAAPPDSSKPWLRPRPLITRDLTVIAARLAATPLPTDAAIAASFRKK